MRAMRTRRGVVVAFVAAVAIAVAWTSRPAQAETTHALTLVPMSSAGDVPFEGRTFNDVVGLLGSDTTPVVPIPIDGMGSIADIPVALSDPDAVNRVVTLISTEANSYLPEGSPLSEVAVDLLLTARWDSDTDTDPDIVVGVRIADLVLSELLRNWGPLAELDGLVALDDAVVMLTDSPGSTLDPAVLQTAATEFLGLDAPTDLGDVANLLGALDLASMPALQQVADFLGVDPTELVAIAGTLANGADLLFDANTDLDPSRFSLDGPITIDHTLLPDWAQDRLPEFRLSLGPAPGRVPTIVVHDELDIVAGGVTNSFSYDVSLLDASDLDITVEADTFIPPYGLEWMGPFTDVALHLSLDVPTGDVAASFDADVPIATPAPRIHVAVRQSTDGTAGIVTVDGAVSASDMVSWLAGSTAFGSSTFTPGDLGGVTLNSLELTYDDTGGRRVLGAFADTTVPTPSFLTSPATVSARALLAASDTDGSGPEPAVLLAALRVIDPACTPAPCIDLGTVLPIPQGTIAADLHLPAVNLVTIQPSGASFEPAGLGPAATAFLAEVLGEDVDPVVITGALQFDAQLPLSPLSDALSLLGVDLTESNPSIHLRGDLDFTLTSLADGGVDPSLTSLNIEAQLPAATIGAPPAIESWFADSLTYADIGPSSLFLRYADDTIAVGVDIPGIGTDLFGDPVTFELSASLSGNLDTGDFVAKLHAALADEWASPFGIDWLTVLDLSVDATLRTTPDATSGQVVIHGEVAIGTERVSVTVELNATSGPGGPSGTFTLALETTVTVDDVLGLVAPDLAGTLPSQVAVAGFGPASLTVHVAPSGVTVDAGIVVSLPLFGPDPISFSLLFAADFPSSGEPRFTFGVRPASEITLGDLLPFDMPTVELESGPVPLDFPLVSPGDADFGFLFSSGPFNPRDEHHGPAVQDWFEPLLLEGAPNVPLQAGLSGLAKLSLPEPLGPMVDELGMQPAVQLIGTLPLPFEGGSLGLDLSLHLVVDPDILPVWIDGAGVYLRLFAAADPPRLGIELAGTMTLLFKQGLEPDVVQTFADLGIGGLPAANPVSATDTCPRGGVNREVEGTGERFCFDPLVVTVRGGLEVSTSGVDLLVGGEITSPSPDGWHPFGFDFVVIRQLRADLIIRFQPTPPPISINIGLLGNIDIAGKNFNGAVQIGLAPLPNPPFVTVNFGGFRAAAPQGISVQDLLDIQQTVGDLVGAPDIPAEIAGQIPNIALRNLEFSFSPLGVPRLCIPAGIVIRADLYVNPTGPGPSAGPTCDGNGAPGPPPDDELCAANKPNGCVAGVILSFTPAGILADGFVAGFSLDPAVPIRFDDAHLSLRLAPSQARLRIEAGASAGPVTDPWLLGRLSVLLEPAEMTFYGQVRAFGFGALVDGRIQTVGTSNPLDLLTDPGAFDPNLQLHIVLAADSPHLTGQPDFSARVAELAQPFLDQIEGIVVLIDGVIDDLATDDPLSVLLGLPARIQASGLPVAAPQWLVDVATHVQNFLPELDGYDTPITLDILLNGVPLPGIPSTYSPAVRTCYADPLGVILGTVRGDTCWAVVGWVRGTWIDPRCLGTETATGCWLIEPSNVGGLCHLILPAALAPDSPGGTTCTLGEVSTELRGLFESAVSAVLDATGLPPIGDIFDAVRAFVDGGGSLFELRCAEADVAASLQSGVSVGLVLDSVVFGQPFGFDVTFDFNEPAESTKALVAAFWAVLTGEVSQPCTGVDDALFAADAELEASFDEAALEPPPPPPPVLSATVSPGTINEGSAVTLDVTFDRSLVATDGARIVSIDWGDGQTSSHTVPIGGRAFELAHTYADDDPTNTASDPVRIAVTDTGDGVDEHSSDTVAVTVRNVVPVVNLSLDTNAVDEHGEVALTVDFTDVGVPDTHDLELRWGDGTVDTRSGVQSGVVLRHRYLDDDPTGTGSDSYTIRALVTDDDRGRGVGSTSVTVANVAPDASGVVLSPMVVDEGSLVAFTVDFTDPGTRDLHTVTVDWGDGSAPSVQSPRVGGRRVTVPHTYVDDDPTATPQDEYTVRIRVTDDDLGETTVERVVTVRNVAPTVCFTVYGFDEPAEDEAGSCPPPAPREILEGETVTVQGAFADPGLIDTHVVTIEWGDDALADTVVELGVGERTFTAEVTYGDNGVFPTTVTVVDDDTGLGSDTTPITVLNVDPTVEIDEAGTVMADGSADADDGVYDTPTFITRAGTSTSFTARSVDPGSDDLAFTWFWDLPGPRFGDQPTLVSPYLVNDPALDPLPSPTVQPRDVTDTTAHTWQQPCVYNVGVDVDDDDGGLGADDTWVVVTNTDHRVRAPGYWYNQYDEAKRNGQSLPLVTLFCYLDVVDHLSRVFDRIWTVDSFEQARDVLNTKQTSDDREIMVRQLLAAWLNIANGSLDWHELVDTDGDRRADTSMHQVLFDAESARLNPASTRSELLAWEDVLRRINGG